MPSKIYRDLLQNVNKETREFVENSVNISNKIMNVLRLKNISQREFARLLEKEESEISKWLSGTHNFTIKTLTKIELILGEKIINTKYNLILDDQNYWNSLYSIISNSLNQYSQIWNNNNLGLPPYSYIAIASNINRIIFSGNLESENKMSIVDSQPYRMTA